MENPNQEKAKQDKKNKLNKIDPKEFEIVNYYGGQKKEEIETRNKFVKFRDKQLSNSIYS